MLSPTDTETVTTAFSPRPLRVVLHVLLGAIGLWFVVAVAGRWQETVRGADDPRAGVLLTLVGAAVGAWFGDILLGGRRRYPWFAASGFAALLASQVFYLVIVWTEGKTSPLMWRFWWLSVVPAVACAHVMALRLMSARGSWASRFTRLGAVGASVMWAGLALQKTVPPEVGPLYLWVLGTLAGISIIGSVVLWVRWRRRQPGRPVSTWTKVGWVVASQVALLAFGFYAGRVTAPAGRSEFEALPSALAHLSSEELDQQVASDFGRLRIVLPGLDELADRANATHKRVEARRTAERRDYYLPAEEDELRALFMTYLAYRSALLRIAATYSGFEAVRDPARRARCFLLAYAAGTGVYDASLALVTTYRDEPAARRKLNEPDPVCDIPAGMFDRIYENVVSDRNAETLAQMSSHYRDRFPRWRADRVLDEQDLDWLARRADVATASIARRSIGFNRTTAQIELLVGRVKGDAYSPVYAAQSMVSSWIGDTRLVQRPPLIRREQIVEMQAQMQPGDILLERRNWFFSNAFLPGFWPHGALYTGTIDDLAKLGIARKDEATGRWTSDDPEVRDRLERFIAHAHDGSPHTVIESVSEGVIFNSLTESMHADYVAVLRPRLGDEQKALAIRRAFLHEGRPYDFEFDFATSDKLVCTELLYRSYQGLLNFELVKIMGRDTLPALEICRKFARERGASGDERELDFVLFLDGRVGENRAFLAGEDEFCESANRPRGFNE